MATGKFIIMMHGQTAAGKLNTLTVYNVHTGLN